MIKIKEKFLIKLIKEEPLEYIPTNPMAEEAARGLQWRTKYKRGGTTVCQVRANMIINKHGLKYVEVNKMYEFFLKNEARKKIEGFNKGEKGYPNSDRIAWALWGGNEGYKWSKELINDAEPKLQKI